ncbi:MAG: serine/threonine protein kinase, partial [Pseudohongiella sp.]|nr:serine/threonine protein kinase [Pseudohongiella sp.]
MAEHIHALPEGYRLHEYELVRVLGAGGFGITYLCFDHNLDQARAIKEYLPADLATRVSGQSVRSNSSSAQDDFDAGLNSFLIEAKMLAR